MTLHLRGVLIGVAIVTVLYVLFVVVMDPYQDDEALSGMNWSDAQLEQGEMDHSAHGATHEMPDGTIMEGEVHGGHDMDSM